VSVPFTCLRGAAVLTLTTIPDGAWVINDDAEYDGGGIPSAVHDAEGRFIGFVSGIPAGEVGDALPNGRSLWHDRFGMYGGQLALFGPDYQFIDDLTPSPSLTGFPNICNDGTYFYVIDSHGTGNVYRVDPVAGTISASISTVPWASDDFACVGISRNG